MNTSEKIIDNVRRLPESLQEEVLDFTHFLIKKLKKVKWKTFG